MTRPITTHGQTEPGCPPEVLDWIAWYPEGDLPESVRGTIDAHAAECASCREEIARMQGDDAQLVEELPDPEKVFARLSERIRAAGGAPTRAPGAATRPRPRPIWVATRRATMAAALALAVGAGVAGAGIMLWTGTYAQDTYLPVSDLPAAVSTDVVRLDVVFRPEVSFGRIHDALNEVGATVVAGPTRGGVMRLHLPSGSDPKAVAARLRAIDSGVALFAEPVVP